MLLHVEENQSDTVLEAARPSASATRVSTTAPAALSTMPWLSLPSLRRTASKCAPITMSCAPDPSVTITFCPFSFRSFSKGWTSKSRPRSRSRAVSASSRSAFEARQARGIRGQAERASERRIPVGQEVRERRPDLDVRRHALARLELRDVRQAPLGWDAHGDAARGQLDEKDLPSGRTLALPPVGSPTSRTRPSSLSLAISIVLPEPLPGPIRTVTRPLKRCGEGGRRRRLADFFISSRPAASLNFSYGGLEQLLPIAPALDVLRQIAIADRLQPDRLSSSAKGFSRR